MTQELSRPSVTIKREPADWIVQELAEPKADADGAHACFYIEKTGRNTLDVVSDLAQALQLPRPEIGYLGRKDKHGITQQWFSAPVRHCEWPEISGTRLITSTRTAKKLKIGDLTGNRFRITLRDVASRMAVREALDTARQGFVNRFGAQRFGNEQPSEQHGIVQEASAWVLNRRRRRVPRAKRSWYLSVLRAFLFNEVAARRAPALPRVTAGDYLVHGFPSAPLWGRGRSLTQGEAARQEALALQPFQDLCEALEHAGVVQGRRALWVKPGEFELPESGETENSLAVEFVLPKGAYATTLLSEVLTVTTHSAGQSE